MNVRQEQLPWNKDDSGGTPQKTRANDLSAFLSGQGAVYASPNWQKEWSGQRFLPDVKDRTGSAVLLPAAAMREQDRYWAKLAKGAALTAPVRQDVAREAAGKAHREISSEAARRQLADYVPS